MEPRALATSSSSWTPKLNGNIGITLSNTTRFKHLADPHPASIEFSPTKAMVSKNKGDEDERQRKTIKKYEKKMSFLVPGSTSKSDDDDDDDDDHRRSMFTTTEMNDSSLFSSLSLTSTSSGPSTPYYLDPKNLVQRTCPPKQHYRYDIEDGDANDDDDVDDDDNEGGVVNHRGQLPRHDSDGEKKTRTKLLNRNLFSIPRPSFEVADLVKDEGDDLIARRLALARRKTLQWAPKVGSPLKKVH